jgi:Zn-dependent protease with chaperone function
MMIRSGCSGSVRHILVLSDELLFLSPILPILWVAITAQSPLALLTELGILVGFLELISRIVLFRNRAIKLAQQDAPKTYAVLSQELQRQPIIFGFPPLLYWTPRDWGRGARVLGGMRSKIFLTGGTVVENEENPELASLILRHELAHIKSGDTRLYVYFLLLVGNAFIGLAEAANSGGLSIIYALVGLTLSFFFYFKVLVRRREFLADARAINASDSREQYLAFLLSRKGEGLSGGFHPTNEERGGAISFDSPVLSRSNLIIGYAFLYVLLHTLQYMPTSPYPSESEREVFWLFFWLLNAIPLLVIAIEILKGKKMKYPLASGETPSMREDLRLVL